MFCFCITKYLRAVPKRPYYALTKIYHPLCYGSHSCLSSISFETCESKQVLKKDISGSYPLAYDPKEVEKGWYEWWEQNDFFHSESIPKYQKKDEYPIFSFVLPPPNVTGNLHIGHTLTATIQDCIARWYRMKGYKVHWIPGYDHGGIATQRIVEKKILKEKKLTKQEIGKEDFIEELNEWKTIGKQNSNDSLPLLYSPGFMTSSALSPLTGILISDEWLLNCSLPKNILFVELLSYDFGADRYSEKYEIQLKKLGSSLDFRTSCFTMDENASKAVKKVFIELYEKNLIYRKEKLVNWSSEIRSVISDIEVDHLEVPGRTIKRIPGLSEPVVLGLLDFFYYPVLDSDEKILVATTRLETMLGDSALAVNPEDTRYSHLIGKSVKHPYTEDSLPIISDKSINKNFGTGIMKITPGHDFHDFELAEKHKLKILNILSDDGTINQDVENFKGKHRLIVRDLLRKDLKAKDLYKESKSHAMSIPFCSRTGDIVEPRLKEQWYLNCTQMGEKAVEVVKQGKLRFIPEHHEKVWFEWFRHLKDWCISRQLWWGHRIPAYKIFSPNSQVNFRWIAARSHEEAVQKASEKFNLNPSEITAVQDDDVLDTWFSSALYPLIALGWPKKENALEKLYPLTLMETGFDILFFWVARMVMLGQQITEKLPFHEVLLHGMVCDSRGTKMTKSLGNTLDPLDVIKGISLEDMLKRAKEDQVSLSPEEMKSIICGYRKNFPQGIPECGTDGLRLSLLSHDVQHQQISIDVKAVRTCRHFCNKIWQGFRFFRKSIENYPVGSLTPLTSEEVLNLERESVDRWILSRLAGLVAVSNTHLEEFNFHLVAAAIRQFWVKNFCDIYLEYVKSVLLTDNAQRYFVCRVMLTCIETFLKVISPVMPFLSEELYQRLSLLANIETSPSISVASYPVASEYSGWRNTVLEADLHTVTDLIEIARSLKARHGVTKLRPAVTIAVEEENTISALSPFSNLIILLAKLESVTFHLTQGQEFFEHHPQDSWVFQTHEHGITVIMDIGERVNIQENEANKLDSIRSELNKLNKMLSDRGYRKNAPLSVQEKTMAKKASLEGELQKYLNQYGKSESEKKEDSSCS
ncbi:valine--tRNA ligase-like [Stegodyphus dumicola]|uniref:valine--tRNA ligase-like n=1 Tax=Stegodyphus dumicola TaxID=202533 RepID=UPI0015AC3105|nr:valine--tRNA ligase-like [Stegodyphus dumicola]